MMELYVFNMDFEFQGVIDIYRSFSFERSYHSIGKMLLVLDFTQDALELLQDEFIIVKREDLNKPCEAAIITNRTIETIGNQVVFKVGGFSLNWFLYRRFVWGQQRYSGDIDHVLKQFVIKNAITPDNSNRVIPGLAVSSSKTFGTTEEVSTGKQLSNIFEEIGIKHEVGWCVLFDLKNKKFVFDVYQGLDLTPDQAENEPVVFSVQNENLPSQSYLHSIDDFANMALVAGAGEGPARKTEVINDEISGWKRRELYVDARDISDEDADGTVIPDDTYKKLLVSRGNSKLAESKVVETLDSEIYHNSQYVYKRDYDLGDKVLIESEWGVHLKTRITKVAEIYENGMLTIQPEFGTNIPDLKNLMMGGR
ncbi:siphovirus ReqiPepy6 Gp37-like family protein [Bacillus wiedmannii]|uniref:siphovirus ReqiPepy6 Gp37-like family protein n=1 Tax=Bacillus wiedmannii TaxID=1890302 RepID=UPI0027BA76BA|nr:siphovirus ReqiPepy6 Gp37-like family protein [Bacillus wiedmannii]